MYRRSAVGNLVFKRFNSRLVYQPNAERARAFKETYEQTTNHGKHSASAWRNISIACVPVMIACAWYVYGRESHHLAHVKVQSQQPDEAWPTEFEYQNVRSRKFFWGNGDRTLFWSWANHHKKD